MKQREIELMLEKAFKRKNNVIEEGDRAVRPRSS